ncbi:MAG: 5'-nucleotidase, lipoprotein e(P4) family [Flavobacteriales bacterium]|nr:5'-nucleotidase, lipoprotein e(P4) family [Flavobacteriales bacterium]
MRIPVIPLLVPVLGLWSCTAQLPVAADAEAAAARELVTQNVNAALYQNASAEVAWLYEQGYAHARLKLNANLAVPDSLPPAVIVDVDETVLDNSPYELENIRAGRGYSPETWKAWTARAEAKPLPGALDFLNYAVSRGCSVFYITNRDADELEVTIANLAGQGFPMADKEHVLTMQGTSDKTARRDSVRRTHRVVLLVGDQLTDFDQVLKDRSADLGLPSMYMMSSRLSQSFILLPNSTYGYWRDGITGKGAAVEKRDRVRSFIEQRVR